MILIEALPDADRAAELQFLLAARSVIVFGKEVPVPVYRMPSGGKTREMLRIAGSLDSAAVRLAGLLEAEHIPLYLPVRVVDESVQGVVRIKQIAPAGGLQAQFLVWNALDLPGLRRMFDAVIDSGLFHVLSDEDRPAFAESLAAALEPGGKYFMLCFSDRNPGEYPLPKRITQEEIRETFREGWLINYIRPGTFENAIQPEGHHAWLTSISRTGLG